MKPTKLGKVAGLVISVHRNVWYGFLVLWIGVIIGVMTFLGVPFGEAIVGGFILVVLHYFSEFWHQYGHAWAARRVGYPMIGIRYWWILGTSVYPNNEPELPGSTHIKRALGGPIASFLLTLLLFILTIVSNRIPGYSMIFWILPLITLDNLFVFTLGAFLPLGFTDGSTILRWWGK